jgi:hypothetical protein
MGLSMLTHGNSLEYLGIDESLGSHAEIVVAAENLHPRCIKIHSDPIFWVQTARKTLFRR